MATRITIGPTPSEVLARLLRCQDLDEVLALGTPTELVRMLFGPTGTKVLVEPFGDALIRGLARKKPTLSSISLAMACTKVLDPGRLITILELDDDGFDLTGNLTGNVDLQTLEEDIELLLRDYKDANRRLRLLTSLWVECRAWCRVQADADAFVREVTTKTAKSPKDVDYSITGMSTTHSKSMVLEWLVQNFLTAEEELTNDVTQGISFLRSVADETLSNHGNAIGRARRLRAATTLVVSYERLRNEITKQARPPKHPGVCTTEYRWYLQGRYWNEQPARIRQLCRLAAFPGISDEFDENYSSSWLTDGRLYRGMKHSVDVVLPEGAVQRRPAPRPTVSAALADLATFVRLGASLPTKPKDWQAFITNLLEPYYVYGTITIKAPHWVANVHEQPLPNTDLVVRVPKDMRELSSWASFMGNCIHSIFGDAVHDGRRVILGLFRGEVLVYNVGVYAHNGKVWEVNSRFNSFEVDDAVHPQVQKLITAAFPKKGPAPKRGPIVRTTPTPRAKRQVRTWTVPRVAEIRKAMRAEVPAESPWTQALYGLAQKVDGSQSEQTWEASITQLLRADRAKVHENFAALIRSGNDIWPLLVVHPVDFLRKKISVTDAERNGLDLLRSGAEEVKLRSTAPLLDDPTTGAAWEYGRLAGELRQTYRRLVLSEPRGIAAMLQADSSGIARWVTAVLWVRDTDHLGQHVAETRTVVFDLPTDALPAVTEQLRLFGDSTPPTELSIWSTERAEFGLTPPRCPQIWLRRTHRTNR
jgi:hypothetical protein